MISHDEKRERKLQAMIRSVLRIVPEYMDDGNGHYRWSCPFCGGDIYGGAHTFNRGISMNELPHSPSCAWLIAKGLQAEVIE